MQICRFGRPDFLRLTQSSMPTTTDDQSWSAQLPDSSTGSSLTEHCYTASVTSTPSRCPTGCLVPSVGNKLTRPPVFFTKPYSQRGQSAKVAFCACFYEALFETATKVLANLTDPPTQLTPHVGLPPSQ
ncbi:unnamed protein product [Protopolystoma xenopodis]|uniref:Uncharacterized protein n=1 Tax=Protopolystoma xenopodis TaxID=117903 RepID=A0A3S5CQR6_9PLAT|nr:unnamed protein product [Protopolystoma xenopodis]